MLTTLNTQNFDSETKNGIKFVAFTANWCGYCQKQKPILKEISDNNIWVGEVNADENTELVYKYGIEGFPSFLLFKNGNLISKFSGYKTKYELLNTLLSYLQ